MVRCTGSGDLWALCRLLCEPVRSVRACHLQVRLQSLSGTAFSSVIRWLHSLTSTSLQHSQVGQAAGGQAAALVLSISSSSQPQHKLQQCAQGTSDHSHFPLWNSTCMQSTLIPSECPYHPLIAARPQVWLGKHSNGSTSLQNLWQIKLPLEWLSGHQTGQVSQEQGSRTCSTPPTGPPSTLPPPPCRRRLLTPHSPSCSGYNMHTTQLSNLLLEGACCELISHTHLPKQTHGMPTRNLDMTCRYAQHSLQLYLE